MLNCIESNSHSPAMICTREREREIEREREREREREGEREGGYVDTG